MRNFIASLFLAIALYAFPAHAQFAKPDGAPVVTVPGNITIGVWAFAQPIDQTELVAVFEQHSDGYWYWTGQGTAPTTSMAINVANAGGPQPYLQNVALPIINADIASVYYGASTPVTPTPPPAGSDPIVLLNFSLVTQFAFKQVNGLEAVSPK